MAEGRERRFVMTFEFWEFFNFFQYLKVLSIFLSPYLSVLTGAGCHTYQLINTLSLNIIQRFSVVNGMVGKREKLSQDKKVQATIWDLRFRILYLDAFKK